MQKLPFDLAVGDYCFGYNKGIHKVTHILFPAEGRASTALVSLESVLDSKLRPRPGYKSACDVAWCRKIDKQKYLEDIKGTHQSQIDNIERLLV